MKARKRKNLGAGGYWRGEKWIAFTWGDKIKAGLRELDKVAVDCVVCGKKFSVPPNSAALAKYCSYKCRYRANYTDASPLLKKAKVCGANILGGNGKQEFLLGLIRDAIGTTCRYCQGILTLENLTIDHIEPYRSSELRRNKAENKEHRRFMDRRENLQVICRKCNQIKLDLDHDQYSSLLAFLSGDEQMKDSVIRRLVMSRAPFRRR